MKSEERVRLSDLARKHAAVFIEDVTGGNLNAIAYLCEKRKAIEIVATAMANVVEGIDAGYEQRNNEEMDTSPRPPRGVEGEREGR